MTLLHKDIDSLTETDLVSLIENTVREGRNIEYKEDLPGNSDDDRREFLADISSFANAAGGNLVYGIKEKRDATGISTGEPEDIKPLNDNIDSGTLRLHEMAQSSIDPPIPGLRIKAVPINARGHVFVVRVPKTWVGLHMVTYKNLSRFFSRNSAGKYQLGVHEIRAAFVVAETGHERLKAFRLERLTKIIANEAPVYMVEGCKAILHIIPMSSLDPSIEFDVIPLRIGPKFRPIHSSGGWSGGYNFDGVVSFSSYSEEPPHTYAQLFRNGTMEACTTTLFDQDEKVIHTHLFERELIEATTHYLQTLKGLGVPEPLVLFLSLTGLTGFSMGIPRRRPVYEPKKIREGTMLFPEVQVGSYVQQSHVLLHSAFDRLWNAAGWERSIYYDDQGNWIGHQ